MLKRIVHTYKEPMVICLVKGKGRFKVPQREHRNLLVGQSMTVDESEIGPELKRQHKKGYVAIEDVVEVEERKVIVPPPPPPVEEPEAEDLEALEQELLGDAEATSPDELE